MLCTHGCQRRIRHAEYPPLQRFAGCCSVQHPDRHLQNQKPPPSREFFSFVNFWSWVDRVNLKKDFLQKTRQRHGCWTRLLFPNPAVECERQGLALSYEILYHVQRTLQTQVKRNKPFRLLRHIPIPNTCFLVFPFARPCHRRFFFFFAYVPRAFHFSAWLFLK